MKYKLLDQKDSCYTANKWERLKTLYEGGEEIKAKAGIFIDRFIDESPGMYSQRLKEASYIPHFASIVDRFASDTFSKELNVFPANKSEYHSFYADFAANVDNKGNKLDNLLKDVFLEALILGKSYIGLDFPTSTEQANNLAEEESLGLARAYAFHIPTEQVTFYQPNKFAVIKREFVERESILDPGDKKTVNFKVWIKDNGAVRWEEYETKCKLNEDPKPEEDLSLKGSGITSFKDIPVLEFKLPIGLWIGNKIQTLCESHFTRLSSLIHAQNRSLFSVKWMSLASSGENSHPIGENENRHVDIAQSYRNKGWLILSGGDKDEVGFLEPEGTPYELINQELKELVDEIHRVTHQMANSVTNTSSSLGRSGLSKMQDSRATEMILSSYGALLKEFAKTIYKTVSDGRGENIIWQASGLESYESQDPDQIIKEALASSSIDIPSVTFKREHTLKIAASLLPDAPQATMAIIKDELAKHFEELEIHAAVKEEKEPEEDSEDESESDSE